MSYQMTPDPSSAANTPQSISPVTAPPPQTLRLWPGVALVVVLWLFQIWAITGEASPTKFFFGMVITPFAVVCGLLLWWLFASRLPWFDRLLVAGTFLVVTTLTVVVSRTTFPAMAMVVYAAPVVATAWVGWLLVTFMFYWPFRRLGVQLIFLTMGIIYSLLRVDGMDGSFKPKFSWRWSPTAEQQMLAELKTNSVQPSVKAPEDAAAVELKEEPGDWPGFRGPRMDGRLVGVKINTDWKKSPPKELWRRRIGPGWSSFVVIGNRAFTQEQRGTEEYVVCCDAKNGAEVWSHHDAARFEEVMAGAGPRATPAFHAGRLYVLGATGNLHCLNAASGKQIWTRDIAAESGAKTPQWGFSSSPVVAQGVVSVFAGADGGKSVVAYNAETGQPAWSAGEGSLSYCSTQLTKVDGIEQLLISTNAGLSAFEPVKGQVLWQYPWKVEGVARIVQPALIGEHDILIGSGMGGGTRRISVQRDGDQWQTKDQWSTTDINPYFNDLVIHDDHLYGFDGAFFTCVSLNDGGKKWRARGYGNGQVLLLADQGVLLILCEQGEVALVAARPDKHQLISKFKAIDGKTWNHPVIAHGKLFVRNGNEAACFELTPLRQE